MEEYKISGIKTAKYQRVETWILYLWTHRHKNYEGLYAEDDKKWHFTPKNWLENQWADLYWTIGWQSPKNVQ